jgi:hypothetical protein
MDAFRLELGCTAKVILLVCIPAIDDGVTRREQPHQFIDHYFGCVPRRNHHPDSPGWYQSVHSFSIRKSRDKTVFISKWTSYIRGTVNPNYLMPP